MKRETLRAALHSLASKRVSIKRFSGNSHEICDQIIDALWNQTYFQTGLQTFSYFWLRDFASMVPALLQLGRHHEVHQTLRFALDAHQHHQVPTTTCISAAGTPFDMPMRAIDSFPWLLYALEKASYHLTEKDKMYLKDTAQHYEATYIDHENMSPRNTRYAELRDVVRYTESAYAITMLALYARLAPLVSISTRLSEDLFKQQLLDRYWTGTFLAAEPGQRCLSTECALMPFFLSVLPDPTMLHQTIEEIEQRKLAEPYPLAYTDTPGCFRYRFWHWFVPDYGGTTLWPWHGAIYLSLLQRIQHPAYFKHHTNYQRLLVQHGTLPELLDENGNWYQSRWYRAEQGMIWAALFRSLPTPQ